MPRTDRRVRFAITALALALALPVSAAPGFEKALQEADASFQVAAMTRLPAMMKASGIAVRPLPPQEMNTDGFKKWLAEHVTVSAKQAGVVTIAAASVAAEIDLATAKNSHYKTELEYTIGGKKVWISGSFDRDQNAFVAVTIDGQATKFYNVEGLLKEHPILDIGTDKVKMYLSPNVVDQLESEIVLKNLATNKKVRVTLAEMFTAIKKAGTEVKLTGQTYLAYYFDDIKGGVADATKQTFAFIHIDAKGEFHIFLIGAELVPSDDYAVFKMYENKRVGLQQKDGKLKIYDNP